MQVHRHTAEFKLNEMEHDKINEMARHAMAWSETNNDDTRMKQNETNRREMKQPNESRKEGKGTWTNGWMDEWMNERTK